jgi:hypothetical protein
MRWLPQLLVVYRMLSLWCSRLWEQFSRTRLVARNSLPLCRKWMGVGNTTPLPPILAQQGSQLLQGRQSAAPWLESM